MASLDIPHYTGLHRTKILRLLKIWLLYILIAIFVVRRNRPKGRREQLNFQWKLIVLGRKTMFPQTYFHPKALCRLFMKLTVMLGDFDI